MRRLVVLLTVTATLWAGGFILFVSSLPAPSPAAPGKADGVAVYTGGGGARISSAMSIFANGAGERLLISGVHPDTSAARLSDFWAGSKERFDCCVDLGRDALTTEGNAGELRNWAATHNFSSIILVTSDYHMPRAMTVTRARMPDANITSYAVASGYLNDGGWPASPGATLKLAGEYTKFLLARMKAWLPGNGR